MLRAYWRAYRPTTYLFPGVRPDTRLYGGTVQRLCKRAAKRAGLTKRVRGHPAETLPNGSRSGPRLGGRRLGSSAAQ